MFETNWFKLYDNVVPETAENFKKLCIGTTTKSGSNLAYEGSKVTKAIPGLYVETGHVNIEGKKIKIFHQKFQEKKNQNIFKKKKEKIFKGKILILFIKVTRPYMVERCSKSLLTQPLKKKD